MCKRLVYFISFILVFGLVCDITSADPYQQEAGPDGIVSIEAENFDEHTPEGGHQWELNTDQAGFTGDGFMRALPDSGSNNDTAYIGNDPRLDFEVNFSSTGTHFVWVRGMSTSGDDDSVHVGIDAIETGGGDGDRIQAGSGSSTWEWSIQRRESLGAAQIEVPSAGVHVISVWMREDGWRFDKLVLTTNPNYTPTDDGPEESSRGPRIKAYGPLPKDGELYSDTWATLSWLAAPTGASHDVYFGESFDEVNDGAESAFLGNQATTILIVGFPGYAYQDGLVPGTTYYWRIDEVEADGTTKYAGDIWSFSIPPNTAYNPDPADGGASIDPSSHLSWTPGFGAVLNYVYFGDNFDEVNNAAGSMPWGTSTYNPGPLELAKTYYWRVDEFDTAATHKGNVWSFTTEGGVETLIPSNGAVDVTQTPALTWVPGVFGASHEVYFGSDAASLELKGSGNLGSESYEPGQLEWNTTYYWRVDEANNTNANSPWTGPLWSFTTANFLIIDDMEAYNDLDPADAASNRIFNAWLDGFGDQTNGALVGYDNPPFAEQSIVNSGSQSMPMSYDNAAGKSEATLTLTSNSDWTVKGVDTLTIWFRGESANAAETMYVMLNGSASVDNDDPAAPQATTWTEWNIDLQAFTDQGVNLANVTSITLGLSSVTGGAGMMYFDDIRLYPPAP